MEMIVPMLVCADGQAEVAFCVAAFAATELSRRSSPQGEVVHATLRIGHQLVMVHGLTEGLASRPPVPDASSPVVIYLYVARAEETLAAALKAGAKLVLPLETVSWGGQVARIVDPAGHVWNVASREG